MRNVALKIYKSYIKVIFFYFMFILLQVMNMFMVLVLVYNYSYFERNIMAT